MTTIIIPVQTTKEVNCIIQEGVRYCEKEDVTSQELGFLLLAIAAIIIWAFFWAWFSLEKDIIWLFPIMAIIAPLLIGGLILI